MVFEIRGKVALITGGASGVGLEYAKALLKNRLKAVTLADVNPNLGEKAVEEISALFGQNRAIFVKTDVTKIDQLEDAFKKTVEVFGNIDILFNNAGILNDAIWDKQISINVNGVIHGIILAFEKYLPVHRQGSEAVIVNISSVAGVIGSHHVPIYSATKHAVIGITRSWGYPIFYDQFKIRVLGVCPGVTDTPLISEMKGRSLGDIYEENSKSFLDLPSQKPEALAEEVIEVVKYAPHGTIWVVEGGEQAYEYIFPDRSQMKNNKISEYR